MDLERDFARRRIRYRVMRAVRRQLFGGGCIACAAPESAVCVDCAPNLNERGIRRYPRASAVAAIVGRSSGHDELSLDVGFIGLYDGAWREAILAFKNGRRDVGDALVYYLATRGGKIVTPAARNAAAAGRLAFVGVPTSAARRRERGFDGGCFLADGLGAAWGVPAIPLLRLRKRDHQRGKNRAERLSAYGRFVAHPTAGATASAVVLIDDVLTTGATLRDACACLEDAGISVLGALTLAFVAAA